MNGSAGAGEGVPGEPLRADYYEVPIHLKAPHGRLNTHKLAVLDARMGSRGFQDGR